MSAQWIYNRLIPSLLGLSALLGLWVLGQMGEHAVYDLFMRWTVRPAANSPVTLVLIDDESLARLQSRFGPVPWPRKVYIDIFSRINRARPTLMVFDGHFIDINERGDTRVFQAMKNFPNLIAGLVVEDLPGAHTGLNTQLLPYYHLDLGVVSMREEPDGTIRTLKPVYQVQTGKRRTGIFPALSLSAATEFLNASQPGRGWIMDLDGYGQSPSLELYPEKQPRQGLSLPLAEDAFFLRWYRLLPQQGSEFQRSHTAIPLWQFYEDGRKMPDLRGRIALIGSSSNFYRDYHKTSVSLRHLGPDIHATAIDNILRGAAIRKTGSLLNLGILATLCLMVMALRLRVRHLGKTLLYTLGSMVIFCSAALWLLAAQSVWIDVLTPELFMIVAFLAGSTFRIIFKEKQLEAMETSLAQLVDPEVLQEIRRRAHVLKPGGDKLEITSMFVDIRNFTALAERLPPAEVTGLLNEFYTEIVGAVFRHHGTIDKFMGDGILIMFGAPLPSERHREAALLAAQDILEATGRLSQRWRDIQGLDTEIGISLNSGPAFVGFLGPPDKLEYTAVGDTVNICVRLQEHTKQFKTRLILSDATVNGAREALQAQIPLENYVPLGEASVRGRESTIRIYTLSQALLQPVPSSEDTASA